MASSADNVSVRELEEASEGARARAPAGSVESPIVHGDEIGEELKAQDARNIEVQ